MRLVKVNPVYGFNAMDRLVNEIFNDTLKHDRIEKNEATFQPATNVFETEDAVKIEMQIPGFSKEQVQISLDKNMLTVRGTVEEDAQEEISKLKYKRVQFQATNFEKKFKLTDDLDSEKITANFSNGILKLEIGKRVEETQEPRKIEIA